MDAVVADLENAGVQMTCDACAATAAKYGAGVSTCTAAAPP